MRETSPPSSVAIVLQNDCLGIDDGNLKVLGSDRNKAIGPVLQTPPCSEVTTVWWSEYDPRREDNLAYIIFFVLGLGSLLPWNAFINASHYYLQRFCGQTFESTFESYFSMCYTASQPLTLVTTIYFKDSFSLKSMVLVPLIIYTLIFVVTTILAAIPGVDPIALFVITVICTFLCGVCSSIISGGLYGLAGILMPKHISALMSGQALIGVIVSLVSILVIALNTTVQDYCTDSNNEDDVNGNVDDDHTVVSSTCTASNSVDYGAFAFFLVATMVLALCVVLFLTLMRLDFVKNALKTLKSSSFDSNSSNIQDAEVVGKDHGIVAIPKSLTPQPNDLDFESVHIEIPMMTTGDNPEIEHRAINAINAPQSNHSDNYHVFKVFTTIRIPAISAILLYAGSIMVFPPLIVLVQSTERCKSNLPIYNELWVSLLFILFNAGDFIGRIVAQMWGHLTIWNANNVWIPSCMRFVIVALFFFCRVGDSQMPMFLDHDAAPIILTAALGLSCGFFANIAMMQTPSLVHPQDASLAGTIMVFCLISGLLIGACLSYLVLYIVIGAT